MFCGTFERKIGRGGNLVVPAQLRKYFAQDVVVVGCGDHVEIWTKEQWAEEKVRLDQLQKEIFEL